MSKRFKDFINEVKLHDDFTNTDFEKTNSNLLKYYNLYNALYFDNKLSRLKLSFIKSPLNQHFVGKFNYFINYKKHNIIPDKIELVSDYINDYYTFRNILVHEMLHYYVVIFKNKYDWNLVDKYIKDNNIDVDNINEHDDFILIKMLKLDNDNAHKGIWKDMSIKLNKDNEELNITENENLTVDEDYKNWYIKNISILMNKKTDKTEIHVLDKNEQNYRNLMEVMNKGEFYKELYIGDWYELKPHMNNINQIILYCQEHNYFDNNFYMKHKKWFNENFDKKFIGTISRIEPPKNESSNENKPLIRHYYIV